MGKDLACTEEYAVPAELLHLIGGFIQRRESELPILRACAAQRGYATIQRTAHNIAGNGGAYGFPQLSLVGKNLEAAAKAKDGHRVEVDLDALEHVLQRIHEHLVETGCV